MRTWYCGLDIFFQIRKTVTRDEHKDHLTETQDNTTDGTPADQPLTPLQPRQLSRQLHHPPLADQLLSITTITSPSSSGSFSLLDHNYVYHDNYSTLVPSTARRFWTWPLEQLSRGHPSLSTTPSVHTTNLETLHYLSSTSC